MSNALLLRLFTSEFFNSWIAVSYLFRYPDNVGIQHYLCSELKKFPISEVEFFLPQLMHLLISRPTESVALECFLVEMCEKSTHMAIMSLWYLQAYLSDLSATPSSPSFELCKRVLNKCQAIVFSDTTTTTTTNEEDTTYQHHGASSTSLNVGMSTHRVRENVVPAVVGIGAMLAGIGQPLMTRPAGDIAIAQGRRTRVLSISSSNAPALARRNTLSGPSTTSPRPDNEDEEQDGNDQEETRAVSTSSDIVSPMPHYSHLKHDSPYHSVSQPDLPIAKRRSAYLNLFASSPSLEDLHRGKAFSVSRYIKSAHQKLNRKIRPSSTPSNKALSAVFDPKLTAMGQSTVPTNSAPQSPALSQFSESSSEDPFKKSSGPRISTASTSAATASSSDDEDHDDHEASSDDEEYSALSQLSRDHRRSLLRSNYFRSEMQFLLALVDIATRLVIVPKQARTSALNAELTLLNHNLPAEICIPLWCPATAEKPHHHRVVRISPSDAVVLNSAERAPYLLMIEVLDDELSFDDDYISALHRMRRLKRASLKKKKKQQQQLPQRVGSPLSIVSSPRSPQEETVDIAESLGSPSGSIMAGVTDSSIIATGDGLGINKQSMEEYDQQEPSIRSPTTPETSSSPVAPSARSSNEQSLQLQPTPRDRRSEFSAGVYAERMRTAAIMLAQLQQNAHTASPAPGKGNAPSAKSRQNTEEIRQRIIKEMMALEEQRMAAMKNGDVSSGVVEGPSPGTTAAAGAAAGEIIEDEQLVQWVVDKDDPSAAVFSEDWDVKKARIRASSPYGHLPNWRLLSVIVKHGSDLRQEQFAIQLIREMQRIWEDTGVDVWVKYFRVLVTSDSSGLIETIRNTISIHSIKKEAYTRGWNTKGTIYTLGEYYERHFGPPTSDEYIKAQDAFMRSLAGYSIACYILQIKDRHNGNILIDNEGHLIHIDFGFFLSNSPGSVGFEMAPFKLPQEYIDLMGGVHGEKFAEYKALMKAAFLAVRKHCENIILLVEMMCKDNKLPCFQNGEQTVQQLRDRFHLQLTEPQAEEFVDKMIMSSCCNVFTRLYDSYQYYSQGIL
ncbi:hypothetical protein K492DRAFT_234424 [Lichtheimia hyalospora FSU 10163]|nr:hypothetical protein K492DRAFT_234424 [Lichtheimia hyalospora FSU 10163]